MPAPIVFFDIAGPDMAKQTAFYRAVFDWGVGPAGQFSAPAVSQRRSRTSTTTGDRSRIRMLAQ